MIYLLWIIPILVALVAFIAKRDILAFKVGAAFLVVTMIYTPVHQYILEESLTEDTEWWGNYATSVHYYDDWDEEVSCRHPIYCTSCSTDSKGNTTCNTYVCGYEHAYDVDYHPEYWTIKYDNVSEEKISKSKYDHLVLLWGSPYKIELNRDYHSIDGDDLACNWNYKAETSEGIITEHTYENRVRASNSIFKADKVDSIDFKQYKLYDYPKFSANRQAVVMGMRVDPNTTKLFDYINHYYGSKKQFKLFICVWKNQSETAAERQRSYWENLNKNEFLVCVSLDNQNNVQWSKCYSWMDKPTLAVQTESYFRENPKFDLNKFAKWLPKNIETCWSRKHFRDFKYIKVDITQSQYTIIFIVVCLLSILQAFLTFKIINQNKY